MTEIKNTRSKAYIVPLLSGFIDIHRGLFVNSFLFDINHPELNVEAIEGIFLLFKWSNNSIHKAYEESLSKSMYVTKHYDINAHYYMVYVKFPPEIQTAVHLILKGMYSKLSDENKQLILNYWGATQSSKLFYILTKSKAYKKQLEKDLDVNINDEAELGDLLNFHEETFNQIIKKVVVK